jgi:YesN/AraC family two-component response regulator
MKIMVVDDERDIQCLFDQRFKNEVKAGQLEFQYAFSAQEALEYLAGQSAPEVVLILSDINMPGMSGLELLKKIKGTLPALKVFMITAYGDDENYRKAMEYGADNYLTKPLDFGELKKMMQAIRE